jgi:hypothetical protein
MYQVCLMFEASIHKMRPMPAPFLEFLTWSIMDQLLSIEDPVKHAEMKVDTFYCTLPVC